jgi:hypothetical protein
MARLAFDNEFLVICGQQFARHGKVIRGPFKTIAKLAKNGWSDRSKILAHVTSSGDVWHEVEFRTAKEAKEALATLRAKKGSMSFAEYNRRCQGEFEVQHA